MYQSFSATSILGWEGSRERSARLRASASSTLRRSAANQWPASRRGCPHRKVCPLLNPASRKGPKGHATPFDRTLEEGVGGGTRSEIEQYYDDNTALFLGLGAGRSTGDIHRPVWAPGVENSQEALRWVAGDLLRQADELGGRDIAHTIDLGCGVGSTLLFLQRAGLGSGLGVTVSTEQVRRARRASAHTPALDFERLDFCSPGFRRAVLEDREPAEKQPRKFDLAFAIESFVHAREPQLFFENAARVLRPGGRLVVCDDFLVAPERSRLRKKVAKPRRSKRQRDMVNAFRWGWQASALMTPKNAKQLARKAGFEIAQEQDLTPWLRLRTTRDRVTGATVANLSPLLRRLAPRWWRSLAGGAALNQCLRRGLVQYRLITWRRIDG